MRPTAPTVTAPASDGAMLPIDVRLVALVSRVLPDAIATKAPRCRPRSGWQSSTAGAGPPSSRPEAHVDHLRAVVGRVAHPARHDVVGAAVGRAEDQVPGLGDHLHRHDAHVERHARDADAVVGELADGARDVGAVAVEIDRVVVVPDEIARRDEARARPAPVRSRTARPPGRAPGKAGRRASVGTAKREL